MKIANADPRSAKTPQTKALWAVAALMFAALLTSWASPLGVSETISLLSEPEALSGIIESVGPVAVVVLLAVAVIVSPIPSGPIAIAAGALLGPLAGGGLTALGALLGALIAFALSRGFGYRPLSTSNLPLAHWITCPRTQVKLVMFVLVSRLIPFISFDAVSYVAGLTTIRPGYFAAATAVGVLPASFAFAALGAGMEQMDSVAVMIAACGVTVILPLGWALFSSVKARRNQVSGSKT